MATKLHGIFGNSRRKGLKKFFYRGKVRLFSGIACTDVVRRVSTCTDRTCKHLGRMPPYIMRACPHTSCEHAPMHRTSMPPYIVRACPHASYEHAPMHRTSMPPYIEGAYPHTLRGYAPMYRMDGERPLFNHQYVS
jgi:hypothetical protein